MKHELKIAVANKSGSTHILDSRRLSLPKKIVKFFFGDFCEVMLLAPGRTVDNIEIYEKEEEELKYEAIRGKRKASTATR